MERGKLSEYYKTMKKIDTLVREWTVQHPADSTDYLKQIYKIIVNFYKEEDFKKCTK